MMPHTPTLWNIIKIYWSIMWRANVLILTIAITVFTFLPIILNELIKFNIFDSFRAHIFSFFPFNGNEILISQPSLFMKIYTNAWSFICSYGLYFYGFKRVIKLNLYPAYLQNTMIFKDYNKVFLIPITIYSFIDPSYFNNVDYSSSIILYLIMMILFYYLLFVNLRKICRRG